MVPGPGYPPIEGFPLAVFLPSMSVLMLELRDSKSDMGQILPLVIDLLFRLKHSPYAYALNFVAMMYREILPKMVHRDVPSWPSAPGAVKLHFRDRFWRVARQGARCCPCCLLRRPTSHQLFGRITHTSSLLISQPLCYAFLPQGSASATQGSRYRNRKVGMTETTDP